MEKELYAEMADLEKTHWWFVGRRAIVFDTIRRFCTQKGGTLLDIGSGTGYNAALLTREGFDVTGVEVSTEALEFTKKIAPHIRVIQASFPSAVLQAHTYNVVTLFDVLEHFEDDTAALRAVSQRLSPGGLVFITVPAFAFLWNNFDMLVHHHRRYTKHKLAKSLEEAGLTPVFVSYFNFFLFPAIVFARLVLKVRGSEERVSDFSRTPRWLNYPLGALFGAERLLLRIAPLPFGVSLLAVARNTHA